MDHAFWLTAAGQGEIRPVELGKPGEDEVLVRTVFSGVSRGTELLVFQGRVPANQHEVMRAPFQEGEFPAPVKYGYLNVGVVEQGPPELHDKTVFCLYPHQTRYVVPASAVTVVPDGVPAERAILAGTVETAVNAAWDAAPLVGDRIAVVGAGMVGASVAKVLAGIPAARVQLVDVEPGRAGIAAALGVEFATPDRALDGCDLVVHASATDAGLDTALSLVRQEGTVLELSWYGDRRVGVPLGEWFHSRRLTIKASQVGSITPARGRSFGERLAVALDLLQDQGYDALITGECRFDELPAALNRLAQGEPSALCTRVRYDQTS
jgi:threonine dehydrogenase-like Zn-dependent dehydrogenase